MKLRNLLLTAALVLTSSIAFALPPITSEQNSDPVFQRDSGMGTWTTTGNNTLNIIVIEHAKGYNYALYGYNTETNSWTELADLNSGTGLSKEAKQEFKQIYKDFGGPGGSINGAKVYEVNATFDNTNISKVGILGWNGSLNQTVLSALNQPATNDSIFTFLPQYENAVAFNNGGLKGIVVMKSASYVGGGNINGAPLPTPIVTLLIALCFGTALVMYRNRKQAKA